MSNNESLFSSDIVMVINPLAGVEFYFKERKLSKMVSLDHLRISDILDIYMVDRDEYLGGPSTRTISPNIHYEFGEEDKLLHIWTKNAEEFPVGALTSGQYLELDKYDPKEKIELQNKYGKYR